MNPPRPLASGRVEVWVLLSVYLFPVFLLPVNRPLPYPSPAAVFGSLLAPRLVWHPPRDLRGASKKKLKSNFSSSWLLLGASGNFWEFLGASENVSDRFLVDFPPQLGTKNRPKSIKNRCQDAFHLGLRFLINFWSPFGPNFDPRDLKNRAPAAARARFFKKSLFAIGIDF